MIAADRFLASKALDEQEWLDARRLGLSATTMAQAMTPSGYRDVLAEWDNHTPVTVNGFMQFGLDSESWLALWAKDNLKSELMPNDWLIRHLDNRVALATPDGLSLDHTRILEIKTTGKDWGSADKVPLKYYRQIQWQLYVTGAVECALVWLLREQTANGVMFSPWFEPKFGWIVRDDVFIGEMVETAAQLWSEIGQKYNVNGNLLASMGVS
jgi:putative phage-type endonuclease